MSTPPPSSSSSSDGPVVAIVTSTIAGVVAITVVYLIIRCCLKSTQMKMKMKMHTRVLSSNASPDASPREEEVSATTSAIRSTSSIAMTMDSRFGTEPVEQFLKDILGEKPMRFSPEDLINFTQNYGQVLGSGGFGIVYKGQFLNGLPMAVKVLRPVMNKRAEEQFMAEVGTIGRTYHINLVKLYGFCFDKSVKALVYEYMENGSLDKYLFEEGSHKIEWGKLYEIAVGTGKGIRYLHEECQQKIVHYDIKPANVLLSANFTPKVADFGLAKFCDRERSFTTFTGARGTPGYAAPELWMPIAVTHKCDVYSFGMLLFEILGRRRNLDLVAAEGDQSEVMEWFPRWVWERFEMGEMRSIVKDCGIDEKESEKAARACQVALWCVQYQPEARPSMGRVVRMLEGEEKIVPPANPFQYMTPFTGSSSVASWATTTSGTAADSSGVGSGTIDNETGKSRGGGSGNVDNDTGKSGGGGNGNVDNETGRSRGEGSGNVDDETGKSGGGGGSGNIDNETGRSRGEGSGNVDHETGESRGGGSRGAGEAAATPTPTDMAAPTHASQIPSPLSPPTIPLLGSWPPLPTQRLLPFLFTHAPQAPTPPSPGFLGLTSPSTPNPTQAHPQTPTHPSLFLSRPWLVPRPRHWASRP